MANAKKGTRTQKRTTTKPATLASQWPQLKRCSTKATGPTPTGAQLAQAVAMGYRQGASNAFAVAMYLRTGGATQAQISAACTGPQLNVWRAMLATKVSKAGTRCAATQTKIGKATCYHIALPAKRASKAKAKKQA